MSVKSIDCSRLVVYEAWQEWYLFNNVLVVVFVILVFLNWIYRLCVRDYVRLRETLQNICVSYEVAKYLWC